MERKDRLALVAAYLNEVNEKTTEATKFDVKLRDNDVECTPADRSGAFHHMKEVVDICRVYGFSCYVGNYGKLMVRIF